MCDNVACDHSRDSIDSPFISKLHELADANGCSQGVLVVAHPNVPFTYIRSVSEEDMKFIYTAVKDRP